MTVSVTIEEREVAEGRAERKLKCDGFNHFFKLGADANDVVARRQALEDCLGWFALGGSAYAMFFDQGDDPSTRHRQLIIHRATPIPLTRALLHLPSLFLLKFPAI